MISRIWHGWTTPANADPYEALLKSEILTGIQGRQIAGCGGFLSAAKRPFASERIICL